MKKRHYAEVMLNDPLPLQQLKNFAATEGSEQLFVRHPGLITTTVLLIGLQMVHGGDALHEAIFHGTITEVKQLVEQGADVNSTNGIGGARPLMYAVALTNKVTTTFLLEHGADPNGTDSSGFFALFEAACRSQTQLCDILLSAGAKVNSMAGPQGLTPLMGATDQNQMDTIDWLLNHNADVNLISVPRRFAEFFGRHEKGENSASKSPLFDLKKDYPVRALHLAVIRGNIRAAELLLNYKADPNLGDFYGLTPLNIAVQKTNLDMVRLLLKHGTNPNLTNDLQPFPPLLDAPTANIASLLIANGAKVNDRIAGGATPLHWFANRNNLGMINLLLQNGADPRKQDRDGRTPADCARSHHFDETAILLENAAAGDPDNKSVIEATLFRRIMSVHGQQINQTGLFDGDWRAQNNLSVTNRGEFLPFTRGFISWDTQSGKIQGIILYLTLNGRPSPESDPYFTTEAALTKKFGPSDIRNLNLNLMAKDEGEWQLPRVGVSLKRIPHSDGPSESVDYELGVVAKDESFIPKPIDGAFGYTLGTAMSQDLVRAARPQEAGGVLLGVRAMRPHVLLSEYALGMTPRTARVYAIWGLFEGDIAQTVSAFKNLLKEARSSFDWDSCQHEKSSGAETLRLVKGDRSIAVDFKSGESGKVSASIRFLDGKILDDAVLESKGF